MMPLMHRGVARRVTIRRPLTTIAVVAVLVLPGGQVAADQAFVAPYSSDSSGWSCNRDEGRPGDWSCEGSASASAADGTMVASTEVSVPAFSEAEGYGVASGTVSEDLFRARPASSATFTIDFQVDAAAAEFPPEVAGEGSRGTVWLTVSAWSPTCRCGSSESRLVVVSDGHHGEPQTFAGPMSLSVSVQAPPGKAIQRDVQVNARVDVRADNWCCELGTVLESPRSAQAQASVVVQRIKAKFAQ